ncbi:hypothetical protein PCORN_13347 [Listeria cornellensis FSL F6-0969]|uniref:NodB homology domain-containing protein n=2 Tax=Listeria cornellensis TaxID=1494961 RepID=W7BJR9_9LIST|nr:hypothetical protein PCORN_13347 [Listeria cornellensis FSL F6-0969]
MLRISGETRPRRFSSSPAQVTGLVYSTYYSASVSAVNGVTEGESSNIVTQKTLLPGPLMVRFLFGDTYMNGTAVNSPSVTNCRLYRKGESTALLTGTVTAGVLRIYVLNNPNIIAGNEYDVRALDGNPNSPTSIPGMATTITAELPKLVLNPINSTTKAISGATEANGIVRINVDNVNRTTVTADASGQFSTISSSVTTNSLVKVEARVGNIYPKLIAVRVDSGTTAIPTLPERTLVEMESFLDVTKWQLQSGAGTSRSADTVNTKDIQSIKLTADKVIAFMRNTTFDIDVSTKTAYECRLYVADVTTLDKVIVYLANDTTLANNISFTINSYELVTGWNTVTVALGSGKITGTFTSTQSIKAMQVRVEPKIDAKADVSFDLVSSVQANKGNILFVFDDAWKEAQVGITSLESKGLRASIGVVEINETDSRFMTNAELKSLNLKGHDLANHTKDHPHLNTLSKADQRTQFDSCKAYLTTNSWTRANDATIYPYGDYNTDTLLALSEGMYRFGRTLTSGLEINTPVSNYLVRTYNLTPDRTVAMAKNMIDYAIQTGSTLVFLNHRLGTTEQMVDTMFWRSDWFEQLATYAKQKVDNQTASVITIADWLLQ